MWFPGMLDVYLKYKDESVSICGGIDKQNSSGSVAHVVVYSFVDTFGMVE